MSIVTVDSDFVHYEVLGRGKPLIFLHSWIGSWRYWIPSMQSVSISYRAYALDLWGFGDSAKRPEKYSILRQVNLLEGFLENMGIGKVALVGHGLGAIVGLRYALSNPSAIDRILLASYPFSHSAVSPRLRTESMDELAELFINSSPSGEAARAETSKADQGAILTSLDELQNESDILRDDLSRIQLPCVIVYALDDPAIGTPHQGLIEKLPENLHYIFFDESGHFPMLDEPSKFNRLLFDLLALNSGESPSQLQLKEEWKRRIR